MTKLPRRPRARSRRTQALGTCGLLIAATLGVGLLHATSASADPLVHVIAEGAPESWAPDVASRTNSLHNTTPISISCYLTGETVSGPYGSENVWDLISGGAAPEVQTGTFVPDADIYTGSNSPVVPPCSMAHGVTIGGNQVPIYSGPGTNYGYVGPMNSGHEVEIKCYSTGTTVSGPYGSENIWDLITPTYFAPQAWIPDALVYTGSNSAVVPHC
jgi:uncharacterized protein YraI